MMKIFGKMGRFSVMSLVVLVTLASQIGLANAQKKPPSVYVNNNSLFLTDENHNPTWTSRYDVREIVPGWLTVRLQLFDDQSNLVAETTPTFKKNKINFIVVFGGIGHDNVFNGTDVPSRVFGGPDDDVLIGGSKRDEMYGGPGNDTIIGRGGDDMLQGDEGDDTIWGLDGNDSLFGNSGFDTIRGDEGEDYIDGGYDGIADDLTGDLREGSRYVDTFVLHIGVESGIEAETIRDFDNNQFLMDKLKYIKHLK